MSDSLKRKLEAGDSDLPNKQVKVDIGGETEGATATQGIDSSALRSLQEEDTPEAGVDMVGEEKKEEEKRAELPPAHEPAPIHTNSTAIPSEPAPSKAVATQDEASQVPSETQQLAASQEVGAKTQETQTGSE